MGFFSIDRAHSASVVRSLEHVAEAFRSVDTILGRHRKELDATKKQIAALHKRLDNAGIPR